MKRFIGLGMLLVIFCVAQFSASTAYGYCEPPNPTDCPTTTPTPKPKPTPTPSPQQNYYYATPTPTPTPKSKKSHTPTPTPSPTSTLKPSSKSAPTVQKPSALVQSIPSPSDLPKDPVTLAQNAGTAGIFLFVVTFFSRMFNRTIKSNYTTIFAKFRTNRIYKLMTGLEQTHVIYTVLIFAALSALVQSQLSPDFKFNSASGALLIGTISAIAVGICVNDLFRRAYMNWRHHSDSQLEVRPIGVLLGGVLVGISRAVHFVPGYFYSSFTDLTFKEKVQDKKEGEGHFVAYATLFVLAFIGWLLSGPVKQAAADPAAGFGLQVLASFLGILWLAALGSIFFGLLPLRFFDGYKVWKWNKLAWVLIYLVGATLYIYTVRGSKNFIVPLSSIGPIVVLFSAVSIGFWLYYKWHVSRPK